MTSPALRRFPVLVFDFDGTLIDSAPEIGEGLNHLLAEHGRPPVTDSQIRLFIGDGAARLVERGFEATGEPLAPGALPGVLARYLELYATIPTDPHCVYPGVRETLARLKAAGHRLGLATNKPEVLTHKVLGELGLGGLLDAVCGGDTLPERKPSPKPLLWVVERLGGTPDGAVMTGDNKNDVLAARAAGMPVVSVAYGYPRMPLSELGTDIIIDRFDELPAALDKLAGS